MLKEKVKDFLMREPFLPLRIYLKDGQRFEVPFRDAARMLSYGVLVFIGLKEGTRQAKSYDRFPFDQIERIKQLPARGVRGRRRKAS